ncbi:hypothetical protein CC86DRAFT_428443 [Ophiobolus disseminans]|uniref:Uncharacterized protein n=1 Tax=Ophiobolus disseminans TaxID=1469910 RepID=A0A6A6ZIF7_9PLEO|nr:hypothetical protein CC86DRAFT_428443 [Ophiobolus disseminans]
MLTTANAERSISSYFLQLRVHDLEIEWDNIRRSMSRCVIQFAPSTTLGGVYTFNEIYALNQFAEHQCASAPWLLCFEEKALKSGLDALEVEGSFMVFTLMTKLRGTSLSYKYLQSLSPEQREHIRKAFKQALLDVRNCGIFPNNEQLQNILWDEEQETWRLITQSWCIVGFQDCTQPDAGKEQQVEFTNAQYKYWSLDEELYARSDSGSDSDLGSCVISYTIVIR